VLSKREKDDPPPNLTEVCERLARLEVKVNFLLWLGGSVVGGFIVGGVAILLKSVFHI
jgi:hypothetical protein